MMIMLQYVDDDVDAGGGIMMMQYDGDVGGGIMMMIQHDGDNDDAV